MIAGRVVLAALAIAGCGGGTDVHIYNEGAVGITVEHCIDDRCGGDTVAVEPLQRRLVTDEAGPVDTWVIRDADGQLVGCLEESRGASDDTVRLRIPRDIGQCPPRLRVPRQSPR